MSELMHRPGAGWPTNLFEWMDLGVPSVVDRLTDVSAHTIRVEEFMREGRMVIRAELPGIDPEKDVDISLKDDRLMIRAERREEQRSETQHGYRSEFRYGSFSRTLLLPEGVEDSDITASYSDGLLEITVPQPSGEREPRRIPVRRPTES